MHVCLLLSNYVHLCKLQGRHDKNADDALAALLGHSAASTMSHSVSASGTSSGSGGRASLPASLSLAAAAAEGAAAMLQSVSDESPQACVLRLLEDAARVLRGGRITSCKSAKVRWIFISSCFTLINHCF